jgi:hypothetical protein
MLCRQCGIEAIKNNASPRKLSSHQEGKGSEQELFHSVK